MFGQYIPVTTQKMKCSVKHLFTKEIFNGKLHFWNRVSMGIAINYFRNYLHLRCLAGFWIRLWSVYNNSEIRRRFLTISQSIPFPYSHPIYIQFSITKKLHMFSCLWITSKFLCIQQFIYLLIYLFWGGVVLNLFHNLRPVIVNFKRNLKQRKESQRFSCYTEFSQTNICTV